MDCWERPFSCRTSTIDSIRSAVRPVAQVESCGNLWATFSRMAKVSIEALAETALPILERYGLMVPHALGSPTGVRASWHFGAKPSFPAMTTMRVVTPSAVPRYLALLPLGTAGSRDAAQ